MVSLVTLTKAAVVAALLNKEIRQTIVSKLIKSMNGSNRSGNSDRLSALIEEILAIMLLRSTKGKGSWTLQPTTISAISALLATLMRPKEERHDSKGKDRIIDIDDFTIVGEK